MICWCAYDVLYVKVPAFFHVRVCMVGTAVWWPKRHHCYHPGCRKAAGKLQECLLEPRGAYHWAGWSLVTGNCWLVCLRGTAGCLCRFCSFKTKEWLWTICKYNMWVGVRVYVCCVCVYVCMHVCVCVCVYVCMHVCVWVFESARSAYILFHLPCYCAGVCSTEWACRLCNENGSVCIQEVSLGWAALQNVGK